MRKVVISLDKKFKKEEALVKKILGRLDKVLKLRGKHIEVYLVGAKSMPKNVMSFPALKNFPRPDIKNKQSLGEIYLSPDFISKNKQDFSYMLVHGFLHLLGYDHKRESDRIKMEKREAELLKKLRKI